MTTRMPVVFFGHGSPIIVLETSPVTETWRAVALSMARPTAILVISAHWITQGVEVTAMPAPRTIHDFGPIHPDLFKIRYPAPGAPLLAQQVSELLAPTSVSLDMGGWGLDHGAWSVLMKAFPAADVPVAQLSMAAGQSPEWRFEQGRKLSVLRDQGVLIIATGNTVHNLSQMSRADRYGRPHDWAVRFSDHIRDAVINDEPGKLIGYSDAGRDALNAHPTPDHYWPLLYAMGARQAGDVVEVPVHHIVFGSIGMSTFVLRPT